MSVKLKRFNIHTLKGIVYVIHAYNMYKALEIYLEDHVGDSIKKIEYIQE